jgi:DNA-binding MarR family transcriptional regulator
MHGLTFVLSQLGFHAAVRFAEAIEPLGLTPPHVGILQLVAREPGLSQQALATRLGIPPNRLVGLIDELEARGLIRRDRPPTDRRVFALRLTADGERMVERVSEVGVELEQRLGASLTPAEHAALIAQLRGIADAEGIDPQIHPGLRKLR